MSRNAPAPDDGLSLANQLCFATYSTAHAFNRVYKALLDPLGLTYPQYLVLLVLWEEENLSVKEIGARLFLDSGTLTPLLKRMEGADLVRRARDGRDERLVRITLTDKARGLRAPVAAARRNVACATGLGADEIAALKLQIERLRESLNAHPD